MIKPGTHAQFASRVCVLGVMERRGAHPNHIELVSYRKAVLPEEREKIFLNNEKVKFQNLSFLIT